MKFIPLLSVLITLSACSTVSDLFGSDEPPPLEGERISVLALQQELEAEVAPGALDEMGLPEAWTNKFWPQAGGYPTHALQHLALNAGRPERLWKADIGDGGSKKLPLTAQPVLAEGKVFTLDVRARLSAFSTENGKRLWRRDVSPPEEDEPVIGGGLAYTSGRLFVTNGYNEVLAVDTKSGDILWRKKLSAAARAAPTAIGGRVFVTTLDNRLTTLNAWSGEVMWEYVAISEATTLMGAASPAVGRNIAVPAFSSGEVAALHVENGALAWSDNLSGVRHFGGLHSLPDIKALPVIDRNLVFAVSFGGKLAAIDMRTGTRVWEREIGGANTPWIAGEHLFVISSNNELIAIRRENGTILWVKDLKNPELDVQETLSGPVLAGERLIVTSDQGQLIEIDPKDGMLLDRWKIERNVTLPPLVADKTLYLLSRQGMLTAYR